MEEWDKPEIIGNNLYLIKLLARIQEIGFYFIGFIVLRFRF